MRRFWQLLAAVYVTVVLGSLVTTAEPVLCAATVPSAGWRSVYRWCAVEVPYSGELVEEIDEEEEVPRVAV